MPLKFENRATSTSTPHVRVVCDGCGSKTEWRRSANISAGHSGDRPRLDGVDWSTLYPKWVTVWDDVGVWDYCEQCDVPNRFAEYALDRVVDLLADADAEILEHAGGFDRKAFLLWTRRLLNLIQRGVPCPSLAATMLRLERKAAENAN